jgi:5-(carboxyamino)imidazole ribonucleotide synthase
MLALAAYPLGISARFFDPTPPSMVSAVAPHTCAHYGDREALAAFAADCDVLTYEFENVPTEPLAVLPPNIVLRPALTALTVAQDRFFERECFTSHHVPVARYATIASSASRAEAIQSIQNFGLPCILKSRRLGYDGKGQARVDVPEDIDVALEALGSIDLLIEERVSFSRELSLVAVRDVSGTCAFYPLIENVHHLGILRTSRCPAEGVSSALQEEAEEYARRIMNGFGYVGVLAIEFFELNQHLIANEMAPRVHNSGHFSIEGAETSQFENHVRAVLGLPLGSTRLKGHALMVNLIGERPDIRRILMTPGAHLHWYGKAPRAGRKVGHVTAVFRSPDERARGARDLLALAKPAASGSPLSIS